MTTPDDPTWTEQQIEERRDDAPSSREPLPGVEEISQDPDLFDDGPRLLAVVAASGTAAAMVAEGRKLLGLGEHPPNHNYVTDWYGFDDAWCDMGISYEAAHSGNLAAVGGKFAYTPAHAQWFKAHGRWHNGLAGIEPGDVIFFDWDNPGHPKFDGIEHVGLVEKKDGSRAVTIECNISDACRREIRDGTYAVGYGRPLFTGASQEDDMPNYVSLGMKAAQKFTSGKAEHAVFTEEYSDKGKAHADGNFPGILSGGKNGAQFVIEVDASGAGSMRLIEVDPAKKYAITKTYPLRPLGVETFVGLCDANQHLYVEVHPSADGAANVAVKAQYWPR